MSLTYATYVTSLANLLVVPTSDSGFQTVLPNVLDDAELRIQRDLDLLLTVDVAQALALTTGSRYQTVLDVSHGSPVVIKEVNVITPLGADINNGGVRNPLIPASNELLNALYTSNAGSTIPQYFSVVTLDTIAVGPWPDANYQMEMVATYRRPQLSPTNTTSYIATYFPDMLIAASMVFASGYQRNFGAAVDDPKMGPTWESHYQALLSSAKVEEDRKRLSEHAIPQAVPPSPTTRV